MKITRALKRVPSTHPGIAHFILTVVTTLEDDNDLVALLNSHLVWVWPRTDLHHWIGVLNRFDAILDQIIKDYDLNSMDHAQTSPFTPRTAALLHAILAFEKVLLENATNRKVFASFDRLNDLLHTTDTDVLLATLRLTLRPAQQFFTSNAGNGFAISEKRLLDLAQGWGTREYGLEMVDLAGETIEIPAGLDEVEWQFYKKATALTSATPSLEDIPASEAKGKQREVTEGMNVEMVESQGNATPAPKPRATFASGSHLATPITVGSSSLTTIATSPAEGLTSVHLGNIRQSTKSSVDLLIDAIDTYAVPESDRLALLQKIRIAKSLESASDRRAMLVVRILAIAIFALTSNDTNAQSKLFLYEPELVSQLSELVHPDRSMPMSIQAAAFYALDAIAKSKSKTNEVASALNASVSHGILMYVLRRTVLDLQGDTPASTHEFIDSLFTILHFFQTSTHIGNMIVGAGVVSLLVDFVKNTRRDRLSVVARAVGFLDNLMYGYASAFTFFCTAGGVPIFVERVKDELEMCVVAHAEVALTTSPTADTPTGLLSFEQASLLKCLLRALQRLMQTAGTTEGLRNLIDTSLLSSVKLIVLNRIIFGPQIFALAINITATFVHNEPTCLTVIQEAHVPEAFYNAIEDSIPASIDVVQAIPNAIGALCLNESGLEQFNSRTVIDHYFSIFSSDRHIKILQERDNGNMIGAAFDELIRHHPSLKDKILQASVDAITAIRTKGRAFVTEVGDEGYNLQPLTAEESTTGDVVSRMEVMSDVVVPGSSTVVDALAEVAVKVEEPKENAVLACIDVMGRFLEGLFQNIAHAKDFAKLDPYSVVLDLFSLPSSPAITPGTSAFASFTAPIRILSENKSTDLLAAVFAKVEEMLDATQELWSDATIESTTIPLSLCSSIDDPRNKQFRAMSHLLTYVALLSELLTGLSYAHGKIAGAVLAVLARSSETQVLLRLGAVYRQSMWETILLKGESLRQAKVDTDAKKVEGDGSPATSTRSANLKLIADVIASLPQHIIPLFQSIVKLFVQRRGADSTHRASSSHVAATIASVLTNNLDWMGSDELELNVTYSSTMLKSVSALLFDDRASSSGIQMLLLLSLHNAGGLTALLNLYARYEHAAGLLLSHKVEDNSASTPALSLAVVQAFAGIKTALSIMERISSHRHILESPQTVLLVSREKDKTHPDYFEPVEFLVQLRAQILPVIATTWEVEWIRKSPPQLVRSIVGILVNILRADGESALDSAAVETIAGSGNRFVGAGQFFFANRDGDPATPAGAVTPAAVAAAFVADESRITQLLDMGFPRTAAITALTRTRNNLAVAAEYLLTHPDIVAAARVTEAEAPAVVVAPVVEEGPVETRDAVAGGSDVVMGEASASENTEATVDQARLTEHARRKVKLGVARAELKPTFLERALSLAVDYSDLVFDIKGAFSLIGDGATSSSTSFQQLLTDLESRLSPSDSSHSKAEEQAIAVRFRVIALLVTDAVYREPVEANRVRLMEVLVRYQQLYASLSPAIDARPQWLASIMLVADSVFSLSEVPQLTTILPADSPLPSTDSVYQGPAWTTEREAYFTLALDLLIRGGLTREMLLSTLRLLLVLTRDSTLSATFVEREGLHHLFLAFVKDTPENEGCRAYAVMILRHVIERREILQPMMEKEIELHFSMSRSKVADMTGFLRSVSAIAGRNTAVFLDAAKKTLKLVQADSTTHYHVALINDPFVSTTQKTPEAPIKSPLAVEEGTGMVLDDTVAETSTVVKSPSTTAAHQSVENAVHFLMSEVMEATKLAMAPPPTSDPTTNVDASSSVISTSAVVTDNKIIPTDVTAIVEPPLDDFFRASFAMSCLAELVASYSACKTSFLTFSSKKAKESATVPPKLRSTFISYLLNDVVPMTSIVSSSDAEGRKRNHLSQWASLVISAVCHDSEMSPSSKDPSTELTSYRKVVLDTIAKAFKDVATSSESTDIRYGRLFALSNLCARLLNGRPYPSVSKPTDDTSMQLAKLMLEKNYAVILTNALADVDLNFPSVSILINSILRPLEQLTKVVTKVGRAKPSALSTGNGGNRGDDDDDSSTDSSNDDGEEMEQDTEEEEAPDLYRNSALGMFEGELEPGHLEDAYMSGSEGDYDEDDDDMDDMEEAGLAPSDMSDMSDDDEDGMIFGDEMDHTTNDGDESGDEDDDEDHGEHDEDDDEDEFDEDNILEVDDPDGVLAGLAGPDGGEAEWRDVLDQLDGAGRDMEDEDDDERDEDGEDGGFGGPALGAALIRDEEDYDTDDDEEGHSDQDDVFLQGELEIDVDADQFAGDGNRGGRYGWDNAFGGLDGGSGAPRRSRLQDDPMSLSDLTASGRPRGSGAPTASHPLLVDSSVASERERRRSGFASSAGGANRTTPTYDAWVETIEQLIGGGAIEQLQRLLGQAGMPRIESPDQLRLQRNPGPEGGLAVVLDPLAVPAPARRSNNAPVDPPAATDATSAPRVARQLAERINSTSQFLPVTTVLRWQEESRISQGTILAAERVARLMNHVINVLHGPARAIAKEDKEKYATQSGLRDLVANFDDMSGGEVSLGEQEFVPSGVDEAAGHEDNDLAAVMEIARSLATGFGAPTAPEPALDIVEPVAAAPPVAIIPDPPLVASSSTVEATPIVDTDAAGASQVTEMRVEEGVDEVMDEADAAPEASGSGAAEAERITIEIHGEMVDITDTGIDPTFLLALPDDMREEVLNQHFRENRPVAPVAAVPSSINSEFLDALPPMLRAEVLRQEAADQRREQVAAAGAGAAAGGSNTGPSDIDPADFLASLAPHLREAVLLEQDDDFLLTLPAALVSEANELRANANAADRRNGVQRMRDQRAGLGLTVAAGAGLGGSTSNAVVKKTPAHREAIQLLDKSGLATLVRLLFFPQPLRKQALPRILIHLCENSRTRSELINLLLTILQDGTRDVSAVDQSFSQMSLRAGKALGTKETPRRKVGGDAAGGALPHFPGESVPNLIAQRCLEALTYLVGANEQASVFFLTEQEITVGVNRRSAKKGKGKEKAVPSSIFPVIVLLGLLDRPALLKTQSMMDSLTQLLSIVTKSLNVLQKKPVDLDTLPTPSSVDVQPLIADLSSAVAPSTSAGPAVSTSDPIPAEAAKDIDEKQLSTTDILLRNPPVLPVAHLRLIVNILDAGECSSKTFSQTLALIQNLSYLSEAREIISEELKSRAQGLCDSLAPALEELLGAINGTDEVRSVTLAKFSPASSLQAKLLRLLKTIDWIHTSPKKGASAAAIASGEDVTTEEMKKRAAEEEKISAVFETFSFGDLWKKLGECLAGIDLKPDLLFIATVLLPLIESLMVVSKYVGSSSKRSVRETLSPMSPRGTDSIIPDSMERTFLAFTDDHRKILNTMVRNNPALMSGSFAILVHNPKVLEFDNKRSYFFSRLHDRGQRQRSHYGALQVNVRRQYVFEDSFHNLQRRSGEEIKYGKLNVRFYNEEGVDAGGVTREWFSVLSRQMFNPGYALFQPQAADALTYQPNKSSSINPEHLSFFKFVGRIIGKALHDSRLLEAYFSRSVYKHMLGKSVDHRDLESIDPEYFKSLVWMLENDIDGVLDLTFSVERDDFGVSKVVDLIPDGRNIVVTNENKAEYVRLIADQRLSIDIKDQMTALLAGLYEIIPKDLLQIFSEKELELLISGLPEIDVDEWRANTDLHGFSSSDPVIGYFWRAVRSFTHEERAKLLQFVSGSSRVPLEGFGALQGMNGITKFSITSAGASAGLPTSHTCFNQMDLSSRYTSYQELRDSLLLAITEGAGGFGFA